MKKSAILIVISLCLSIGSYAQESGDLLVGGTLQSWNQDGFSTGNGFNIGPAAIYMISDNFSVGGRISYGRLRSNNTDNFERYTTYGISPEVRYFFGLGDNLKAYARASLGFFATSQKEIDGNDVTEIGNRNSFSAGINPGIFYLLGDKVVVDLSINFLSYSSSSFTPAGTNNTNTNSNFNFGFDTFQPSVALYWKF